jgi:hypothetical protein
MPLVSPTMLGSREYSAPATSPEPETPGAVDTLAAAFRQNNVVSSLYDHVISSQPTPAPVSGYALSVDDVVGYEDHVDRLLRAQSPAETQQIKSKITRERQDQATIKAAGKWGLAASITAGLVDPATLISMAIPGGGATRVGRIGSMIATDAAVDTASELAMHQLQETRTMQESFINVGAGAVLNGVLGTIATRASKSELSALDKAIRADWNPDSTAGASAVGANLTKDQLGIASGGEMLAKTVGAINPLNRAMTSESKQVRQVMQQLAEVPYIIKANDEGIASETAVETLIKRHDASKAQVVTASDKFYKDYAERMRTAGEKPVSFDDFRNEVGLAMFRKDASDIPEAAANAGYYRKNVIDPYTKMLQEQKLLNDPVKEDQERLTNESVDKYVKVESKQIYSDYLAQTLSKVLDRRKFARLARQKITDPGEFGIPEIEDAASKIVDLRTARATAEQGGSNSTVLGRAAQRRRERELINAAHEAYSKRLAPVSRKKFNAQAEKARSEASDNPHVQKTADLIDRQSRGELASVVTVPTTKKTGFDPVGAVSYRPRLYDVPKIKNNLTQWNKILTDHLVRQGVDEIEAKSIAQDVTNGILGTTRGQVSLSPEIVVKAGPLKDRTLTVPDELLSPFLINDAERLMVQYVSTVAPQIEVAKKFGSIDMKDQLQAIDDEFGAMIEAAPTDKAKRELTETLEARRKDILGVRDRLLGTAGAPSDPESWIVRGQHLIRDYNYVRLLGSQVFSSIADAGRIVTRHGMTRTAVGMAKFATNMAKWKMARADAKRMGIGLDWTLNTRAQSLGDIGEFANTRAEQISQRMTSNFSRLTGMATWNSTMKFLTTALEQDAVLDAAERIAKGNGVSAYKLTKLAQSGLDADMLKRIAAQAEKHGEHEGLRRGRSELWDDKEAQTLFEAAMLKASDIQVLNKGAGDTPLIMSNEMAKTIFQFQGFGMAAVNRLIIPASQGLARGDLAMLNGLMVMLGLGTARYYAKQVSSDQPIDSSPANLMREAVDGAGLTSYFVQPYDVVASITGLPRFSRFSDRSISETLSGPTAGTLDDLVTAAGGFKDGLSRKDIHRIRKLMPYQNLFYIRRAINALEEETGDVIGASD